MKLTPDQRRKRIHEIMDRNPEFIRLKDAFDRDKRWFDAFTARLPRRLRNRLRSYPGMMYFLYCRVIDTVCRDMRFPDESDPC